jgi:nitrous oxide reductase accessory protein NosL
MKRLTIAIALLTANLWAQDASLAKIVKLSQKGKKILHTLCDEKMLPSAKGSIEQMMQEIATSKACPKLSKSKLKAVAYFMSNGDIKLTGAHMAVPADAKCPVCGMFISKYPKWAGVMMVDGKRYYFDGVKDMMKYYIFDIDFPYDREKISQFRATDFYTLESISARDAFYVLGSDVYGPMGNELIPFKTQDAATNFMRDHKGQKIVRFDQITPSMVMALDGVVYEE